jgi:hypothetical protein
MGMFRKGMKMVSSIGDYLPMTRVMDVGPMNWDAVASFPSSGVATETFYKADITAYYQLLVLDMTAYRPTTELPAYGHPFAKHAVRDDQEETPGAGIRVNGDTESATNENDLIEVELKAEPYQTPSGLTYVLKRNNSNIKVWDSQTMGTAILDSGTEATITFIAATKTVWVENPSGGSADLDQIRRHRYLFRQGPLLSVHEYRDGTRW